MPGRLRWTLLPEDRLGDSLSVWPWIEKLIFQLKANASPLSNGKHAATARRRLSRTYAVLARVISKVWVPMSGMKVWSLVVLSNHSASRAYRGGTIPWAPNHYGGAKSLRGAPKCPNNVRSTFFNTVDLLPKDFRFEHGGPNLLVTSGVQMSGDARGDCLIVSPPTKN